MKPETEYRYDPETCRFVEIEETPVDKVRRYTWVGGLALLLAGVLALAMDAELIRTPTEQALQSENKVLQDQLERASGELEVLSEEIDELAERDEELYRTLLQVEPISDDVRQVGVGGNDQYASFDRFEEDTATLLRETESLLDEMEREVGLQSASYRELVRYAEQREDRLAQLPVLRPVNGDVVSGYGYRTDPILGVRRMHGGVDFVTRVGTPVVASADGVVLESTYSNSYGNYVDIRHPETGYITRYAHLSEAEDGIRAGTQVKRGELIAYTGNSGRSTGPHLHYEVRNEDEETLNPIDFFLPDMTPQAYISLASQDEQHDLHDHHDAEQTLSMME
ncbi:MAG: M23 family metallopeptidase [Longimonas sp.]|uniref:M23 family metallopeptidase n=1 Tax=Longimonas sp. TaxID=2039626 RepID=UPI003975B4B2